MTIYGPRDSCAAHVAGRVQRRRPRPVRLAEALNEAGVESRAGCHCATLAHRALGLEPAGQLPAQLLPLQHPRRRRPGGRRAATRLSQGLTSVRTPPEQQRLSLPAATTDPKGSLISMTSTLESSHPPRVSATEMAPDGYVCSELSGRPADPRRRPTPATAVPRASASCRPRCLSERRSLSARGSRPAGIRVSTLRGQGPGGVRRHRVAPTGFKRVAGRGRSNDARSARGVVVAVAGALRRR